MLVTFRARSLGKVLLLAVWCAPLVASEVHAEPAGSPELETPVSRTEEQPGEAPAAPGDTESLPAASPSTTVNDEQAHAGDASSAAASGSPAADTSGADDPQDSDLERRLQNLEEENLALREELELLAEDQGWTQQQVDRVMPKASLLSGYIDFGFFVVSGDGRGIRPDIGHENFPEYDGVVADSWVFMGDPLATAINSRGEPADVSESRAVTFNPVGNEGEASFILNALNLAFFAGLSDDLTVNAMVDFVPRGRDVSDPDGVAVADYLDVKLGYVEYRPATSGYQLSLFAGKFDSVLGVEYRSQESPQRITITPSLICRYTCGRPLGLKARGGFFEDALVLNVAVTNGSHSTEGFPIYDEIDSNAFKTGAARLSYAFDVGAGLEFGASGSYGAQDLQTEDDTIHWHYGADARLDLVDLVINAEFVQGKLEGRSEAGEAPCGLAPCLEYKGAYGLVGYRINNWLMPYGRVDWRSALHRDGASFVYISDLARGTLGTRLDLGTSVVVKAEYVLVRELGSVPEFPNDVFTSSLVAAF